MVKVLIALIVLLVLALVGYAIYDACQPIPADACERCRGRGTISGTGYGVNTGKGGGTTVLVIPLTCPDCSGTGKKREEDR